MKQTIKVALCATILIGSAIECLAADQLTVVLPTASNEVLYANLTSAPLKLGYFKEEGLEVNFVPVPGGSVAAQVVGNHKGDMYFGPMDPMFKSRSMGGKLKGVYVVSHGQQYFPVVASDSPIRTIADFKGKKLGVVNLGAGGMPFYKALLKEAGLDPDRDISFIAVGQGAQALAALKGGLVDGLALWDTEIATFESLGFNFHKFLPQKKAYVSSSIVTTEDVINRRPNVVKAYLRAVAKGTVYCLVNKEACVKMHWEAFPETKPQGGGSPDELAKAVNVLKTRYALYDISKYEDVSQWGNATDTQIDDAAEFLVSWGNLDKKLSPANYFDRQFLKYANDFNYAEIVEQAKKFPK